MIGAVKSLRWPVTLLVILIMIGQMGGMGVLEAATTAAPSTVILQQPAATAPASAAPVRSAVGSSGSAYFARFWNIDGEATDRDHKNWTDIESFRWGASLPVSGSPGQATGRAKVDEFQLGLSVDKSSTKLLDTLLTGQVLPMVIVEMTETRGDASRQTFLKYEFKNVLITKYDISGAASSGDRPMVMVALNFEEVKVTYTEFDAAGRKKGDTIVQWSAISRD